MRSLPPPTHTAAVRPCSPLIGEQCERCLYCRGTHLTREGRRYKKLETVQLWCCHECDRSFTPQIAKGKTFPLAVILDALMRYYRGETRRHVTIHIKERFRLSVSPRTLSQWLAEYRPLTTYARLHPQLLPHLRPHQLICSTRLHHQQVYYYRIHRG
jgi:transposase-like protein